MGPGFFIIAILGCADGSAACTPVATLPTRYESRAACPAATSDALIDQQPTSTFRPSSPNAARRKRRPRERAPIAAIPNGGRARAERPMAERFRHPNR